MEHLTIVPFQRDACRFIHGCNADLPPTHEKYVAHMGAQNKGYDDLQFLRESAQSKFF